MIQHTQIYTTRCLESSGETFRLSQLEGELTRAMRVRAIGSAEGRRLFALRARVRQQLANRGEDIVLIAHRDSRMTEWALDQPAGGAA